MDLETFLRVESNRGYVGCRKVYLVMLEDDISAALLLSQIVYWHTPGKNGQSKLRVRKNGYPWLAKGDAEWQKEIGLTAKQVRRAKKILLEKQLIVTAVFKFAGTPKTHYRLNNSVFIKALEAAYKGQFFEINPTVDAELKTAKELRMIEL